MSEPSDALLKFVKLDRDYSEDDNKLLYHCDDLFEKVNYSPRQLFASIAKNLELRKVPDLEIGLVAYPVAGPFSGGREYLQMRRERLVFEISAGPFGSGFFVSSRLFDRRREANVFHFLLVTLLIAALSAGPISRHDAPRSTCRANHWRPRTPPSPANRPATPSLGSGCRTPNDAV